jgi:hypothetical protein
MVQTKTGLVRVVVAQPIPAPMLVEMVALAVMGIHGLTVILPVAVAAVEEKMLELVLEDLEAAVMVLQVLAAQVIITAVVVVEQGTRVLGMVVVILAEAATKVLLLLLLRGNHGFIR